MENSVGGLASPLSLRNLYADVYCAYRIMSRVCTLPRAWRVLATCYTRLGAVWRELYVLEAVVGACFALIFCAGCWVVLLSCMSLFTYLYYLLIYFYRSCVAVELSSAREAVALAVGVVLVLCWLYIIITYYESCCIRSVLLCGSSSGYGGAQGYFTCCVDCFTLLYSFTVCFSVVCIFLLPGVWCW